MQASARYEEFVAGLARTLLRNRNASEVRCGLRNQLVGSSGVRHQLDVSFVDRSSSPHTLVVVECKYLRQPVKLAHVKVLKATIDDLAGTNIAVKGILVSLRGAQRGAIDYAKHYDIGLQLLSDGSFYRFKYADLELVASSGIASGGSYAVGHGMALRGCKLCGSVFESDGTPELCNSCATAK
jgi:hypothetical protein